MTPADVHTLPSRTKIGSGSTVIDGYRRAMSRRTTSSASSARLPSSIPAAASTNAPVHTDATRAARCAACRPPHEARVGRGRERALAADDDERVDRPAHRRERPVGHELQAACRRDRLAAVAAATTELRQAPGRGGNTSCGPTRSSAVMPG